MMGPWVTSELIAMVGIFLVFASMVADRRARTGGWANIASAAGVTMIAAVTGGQFVGWLAGVVVGMNVAVIAWRHAAGTTNATR